MKALIMLTCLLTILSGAFASPLPQIIKPYAVQAKFNDGFGRFNAHRQQNGVALSWTFTNSNNAVAFVVERSYDGEYFETIAEVSTNNARYQHKDNAVYPGFIHYRVRALMYDGSSISSWVEVVRIVRNG